jgi:tetratricopeptide (TPR) repeat protein
MDFLKEIKMKFRPLYAYLSLILILIVLLVVFTRKNSSQSTADIANQEMPNDDIHKGLKNGESPNKSNVSADIIRKMEELKKEAEDNPNDTLKVKEYADFLTEAHKPDEAIKYYQKILKVDPKRTDILFSLSFIYYNKKDYDKSEELTNQILSYDKDNALALYNLGAISATKGDKEKAKDVWDKVIKKYPNTDVAKAAEQSLSSLKN